MSTRDDAIRVVDCYLANNDAADIVDALLARFDLRPKATAATPKPEPAVGQVWRVKASDRLRRIERVEQDNIGQRFIYWVALSGKGQNTGHQWDVNWKQKCEFVSAGDAS